MEIPLLGEIFDKLLWPIWTKALATSKLPKIWKKCFQKAAQSAGVEANLAATLSLLPSLQRLRINTFKADRPIPSATDFAVAIAFEIHHKDYECAFDTKFPNTLQIRHWAVNARHDWLNTIIESPILRKRFMEIRNNHPSGAITTDASCMPEFEKILENRIPLLRAYFESFSTADATETVYIWLPGDDQVVYDDKENRIIVEVTLNTTQGADRGFFRVGHDYSLSDSYPQEWLHVCYLDDERFMETGEFGDRTVGHPTNHVLWAR